MALTNLQNNDADKITIQSSQCYLQFTVYSFIIGNLMLNLSTFSLISDEAQKLLKATIVISGYVDRNVTIKQCSVFLNGYFKIRLKCFLNNNMVFHAIALFFSDGWLESDMCHLVVATLPRVLSSAVTSVVTGLAPFVICTLLVVACVVHRLWTAAVVPIQVDVVITPKVIYDLVSFSMKSTRMVCETLTRDSIRIHPSGYGTSFTTVTPRIRNSQ